MLMYQNSFARLMNIYFIMPIYIFYYTTLELYYEF